MYGYVVILILFGLATTCLINEVSFFVFFLSRLPFSPLPKTQSHPPSRSFFRRSETSLSASRKSTPNEVDPDLSKTLSPSSTRLPPSLSHHSPSHFKLASAYPPLYLDTTNTSLFFFFFHACFSFVRASHTTYRPTVHTHHAPSLPLSLVLALSVLGFFFFSLSLVGSVVSLSLPKGIGLGRSIR